MWRERASHCQKRTSCLERLVQLKTTCQHARSISLRDAVSHVTWLHGREVLGPVGCQGIIHTSLLPSFFFSCICPLRRPCGYGTAEAQEERLPMVTGSKDVMQGACLTASMVLMVGQHPTADMRKHASINTWQCPETPLLSRLALESLKMVEMRTCNAIKEALVGWHPLLHTANPKFRPWTVGRYDTTLAEVKDHHPSSWHKA